jgi:hypothetical protein
MDYGIWIECLTEGDSRILGWGASFLAPLGVVQVACHWHGASHAQSSPRHRYPLVGLIPDPTPPHQTRTPMGWPAQPRRYPWEEIHHPNATPSQTLQWVLGIGQPIKSLSLSFPLRLRGKI